MNAIFNAVSMEESKRISNVEVAHTAWNILQTVHEGTKAVKINKLQQLTSKFESIKMSDDEFYAKLNDIVNFAYNLGEIYDRPKIVRKILRSLTENFRPKVTSITESKDVDFIPVDELVGSLQSYELDLPKTSKCKSMALKSVDDVEVGGFDDELSATEIAYLFKNFRPKVTAITESKDVNSIPVDELVGSLQSYELDLPKTSKSKLMALKSVNDVEVGGFDDELSTTEIAYLANKGKRCEHC